MTKAVKALSEQLKNRDLPEFDLFRFGDFSPSEVAAINLIARKQAEVAFDERALVKAMDATTPVLARPRVTNRMLDLWRTLAQPEIVESLWPEWNSRTGSRGRDPGYLAKAILVMTAVLGMSAHIDDNHALLTGREGVRLRAVFDWVERTGAAATGRRPQPLAPKSYERTCQQINLITDPARNDNPLTIDQCLATNSQLWRWLGLIHPEFGVRLGIDAMLIKGWVRQVGRRSVEAEEAAIRRRAPNATARMIAGRDGKPSRFARGYYLVTLTDLATGIPVTWGLWPAGDGYDDHRALNYLLADLFERWADFPVEQIVADRAWNSKDCVRDCAVRYGVHLITGQDSPSFNRKPTELSQFESATIGAFDGRGVAFCRKHKAPMMRAGHSFVGRARRKKEGLQPGEAASEGEFRLRFKCPVGGKSCGTPHLHMSRDWNALSYHPHTIDGGRADLQALRLAMYARRNTCESLFGALKLGHKLGLESADRTHTANESTVETLLSLALLMRTAFTVANERIQRGDMPDQPPPDLAAVLLP